MSQINGAVMLDVQGTELTQADRELIEHPQCGGIILFARNFISCHQVQSLIQSIRAIKENLLVAVDQEGGRVQRFKNEFSILPANGQLGVLYQQDAERALIAAHAMGELMASEVLSVGCDISFAPVLDLGLASSRVIGDRAFSTDAAAIVNLAGAYIAGMNAAGMKATAKHFPGHGSIEADSHVEMPIDEREFSVIQQADLRPFESLKNAYSAVMPAHVIYKNVDPNPAGFSDFWVNQVLREQIGFSGAVFSDDLSMEGASVGGSFQERAKLALSAGCDMVLVCNNQSAAGQVLESLAGIEMPESSRSRLTHLRSNKSYLDLMSLQKTQHWRALSQKVESLKAQF